MPENTGVAQGYTMEVIADSALYTLSLLVKPGTEFDTSFKAYCLDEQEFIIVHGFQFDEITDVDGNVLN